MSPFAKVGLACALAAMPAAALAHHGWSSYNEDEPITLTGPLKDVRWGNPHGSAKMNWRGAEWDVVLAPVSRMEQRGLTLDAIDDRKRVTITGYIRRDGTREMRVERIRAGGKVVELR
ncbi:DUF6152 family protein [Pelagerythrobacter sp.]|uniref:DUF6152 family protein n=1 Tax=Pelagerythrobacter sp. TaxID=2800702 RepID=UPI0035B4951A